MSEETPRLTVVGLEQLGRLPKSERQRIRERVLAYAEAPQAPHHDVVRLVGADRLYRLRAGDWRVVFRRDGETMVLMRISHRREAYR